MPNFSSNNIDFFEVFIGALLIFLLLLLKKHYWKLGIIIFPWLAVIFWLWAQGLNIDNRVTVGVAIFLLIIDILYFFGQFRVSMWVYYFGQYRSIRQYKFPKKLLWELFIISVLIVGYFYGHLLLVRFKWMAKSDLFDAISLIFFGIVSIGMLFWIFLGIYKYFITSAFSIKEEPHQCAVVTTRVHTEECPRRTRISRNLVYFEGDSNAYSVTPALYKKMKQNIGTIYQYTVITGLDGKQFVRKRPQKV